MQTSPRRLKIIGGIPIQIIFITIVSILCCKFQGRKNSKHTDNRFALQEHWILSFWGCLGEDPLELQLGGQSRCLLLLMGSL